MKPLSIADYLDHLGRSTEEKTSSRPEGSPFRPRSLPSSQNGKPASKAGFDRVANAGDACQTPSNEGSRRTPWNPKSVLPESTTRELPPTEASIKPDAIAAKLTDAYARGREQGLAEGRVEAEDRHAAETTAAKEKAEMQQQESRLNECGEFESAIRSGFKQIEDDVGSALTRILAPFLSRQVVKRAVEELATAIARACAGSPSALIKIRGPERVLSLLRQRIAGLPVEVAYVADDGAEIVVEANATQIVAELGRWDELLTSLEM